MIGLALALVRLLLACLAIVAAVTFGFAVVAASFELLARCGVAC